MTDVTLKRMQEVVSRYQSGEPASALQAAFGLSRISIAKILQDANIAIRSTSEAARLRWARLRGREEPLLRTEISSRHQQKNFAKGLCPKCGKTDDSGKTACRACLDIQKLKRKTRKASSLCVRCGQEKLHNLKANCDECLSKINSYASRVRDEAFAAYGGYCCRCCGETEPVFLALDHIDNDGAAMRKIHGTGASLYGWLKCRGFPGGFQVLCHNCNYAKHIGVCPHQVKARLLQQPSPPS